MKRLIPIALMLLATYGAAFCEESAPAAGVVSETLLAVLKPLVSKMIDDTVKEGKALPPGATQEQITNQAVESFKPFITVSADEEARFKKGEFDDAKNLKQLDEYETYLQSMKIDLPLPVQLVSAEHKAGKLTGARLELAVRIDRTVTEKIKAIAAKAQQK